MTRLSTKELAVRGGRWGQGMMVIRPETVPENAVVSVLRVPPESAGMRLDHFVKTQLSKTSRTRVQRIIERGAYSPEAKHLKSNDRVYAEQFIFLWRPPWDDISSDIHLDEIYVDDDIFAINKPANLPVHPTARYHNNTVVKILERQYPDTKFYLAHRLDRETSGVLLLTKNKTADRHVKAQFAKSGHDGVRTVLKQYLALVWGKPEWTTKRIEIPLQLDLNASMRVKMRTVNEGGLYACTICEWLESKRSSLTGTVYSLIRCTLETGRQHQIRVHLAHENLPIVGDKLYGPSDQLFTRGADGLLSHEDRNQLELDRHALHAAVLEIDHPTENRRLRIFAPLAPDIQLFWDSIC